MRICLVYDCLFPYTVGGAERWYRNLAERLIAEGHSVTYLTMRQWDRGAEVDLDGVDVIAVAPRMRLYAGDRRRVLPPLVFGAGVLWHLLRHGHRYNVVHTCAFPYFALLAAALARPLRRFALVVDWFEVWSRGYWRDYLGGVGGRVGWLVQRACAAVPQRAFCFSALHARRLREAGLRGALTPLRGLYAGPLSPGEPAAAQPSVVFAGRHIPEKRASAVVPAVALAARRIAGLRATIFGDGPDRPAALAAIAAAGPDVAIDAPGFTDASQLEASLRVALCMLLPSRREGYGLIVVESAALGVPSIVVREPDNAAAELIDDGVNGVIADSAAPEELAAAIVRVHEAGEALRASTRAWFAANARRLSLDASPDAVVASYRAQR